MKSSRLAGRFFLLFLSTFVTLKKIRIAPSPQMQPWGGGPVPTKHLTHLLLFIYSLFSSSAPQLLVFLWPLLRARRGKIKRKTTTQKTSLGSSWGAEKSNIIWIYLNPNIISFKQLVLDWVKPTLLKREQKCQLSEQLKGKKILNAILRLRSIRNS
jgi:hypothetical protein